MCGCGRRCGLDVKVSKRAFTQMEKCEVGNLILLPESRTSIMASLLVLVERSRDERTSRLMRGRDAIVMDDMVEFSSGIAQEAFLER